MAGQQKFNLTFDINANVAPIKTAINSLTQDFNKLNIPSSVGKGFQTTLETLTKEMANFEAITSKGFSNLSEIDNAQKSYEKINHLVTQLSSNMEGLQALDAKKLIPTDIQQQLKSMALSLKGVEAQFKSLQNSSDFKALTSDLNKATTKADQLDNKLKDVQGTLKRKNDYGSDLAQSIKEAEQKVTELKGKLDSLNEEDGPHSDQYKSIATDLNLANRALSSYKTAQKNLLQEQGQLASTEKTLNEQLNSQKNIIQELTNKLNTLQSTSAGTVQLTKLRQQIADLKGVDVNQVSTDLTVLKVELEQLANNQAEKAATNINNVSGSMANLATAADNIKKPLQESREEGAKLTDTFDQMSQVGSRINYFFGLINGVNLLRRSIRSAITSIKELDAVMTEMAVVTDLDVGDYWNQLPEYTRRANELGIATKSAYEAATLYYQQGLKTDQVIGISNQTLKMAKIASLDAAEATDRMTAALRGFNMEINENSAQRVADVYSSLAAQSASNVDEISTAMSKTASLAHNAGMEFETTAAFLASIVETTRESAETAGTALKTVIARFQELKKDPAEIGEVDGEVIDANKIETALKTIGVALRDTSGQFRDLDDVFLEIAAKWDSLDTNTQRYIATIAAGSRQQSRFIAMMSDYSRTQELIGFATNASGQANKQYEKTLESLESKMAKLKNAWDQFTMGISNNQIIKAGVDALTALINAINKLTGSGKTLISSLAKLGVAFGAFKLGGKLAQNLSASLASALKKGENETKQGGKKLFESFSNAWKEANAKDKKALTPKINYKDTANKLNELYKQKENRADSTEDLISSFHAASIEIMGTNEAAESLTNAFRETGDMQTALWYSTNLNTEEREKFNESLRNGTTITEAFQEATGKLINVEEVQNLTNKEGNEIEESSVVARLNNFKAMMQEKTASINLTLTQLKLDASNGALTENIKKLVAAQWANVKATIASAAAAVKAILQIEVAGMALGWILALILAVAAAIALVTVALINASPEKQLEAAAAATEQVKEAADAAAESYNNLADSIGSLDEKYKAIDDLTKNTREWKDAVDETNASVLDLIDKYPELAKFVDTTSTPGVLKIDLDSQEVQDVLDEYKAQSTKANAAVAGASIVESRASIALTQSQARKEYAALFGGREGLQKVTDALMGGELRTDDTGSYNNEAARTWFNRSGLAGSFENFVASLDSSSNALIEYSETVNAQNKAIDLYYAQIGQEAYNLVDINGFSNEQTKMINSFAQAGIDTFVASQEQAYLNKLTNYDDQIAANELRNEYARAMYGDTAKVNAFGKIVYTDEEGNKQKISVSDKEIAAQMAAMNAAEDFAGALSKLPDAITGITDSVGPEIGKGFADMFSAIEGTGITASDLTALGEANLQELFDENEELQALFDDDFTTFKEYVDESIQYAQDAFANAKEAFTYMEMDENAFDNYDLTAGAIEGITSGIEAAFDASGRDAATQVQDYFKALLDSGGDLDAITAAISEVDWTDTDSIESFSEKLKTAGVDWDKMGISVEELEDKIKALTKATKNVDFDKLITSLQDLTKVVADIANGSAGRSLDSSSYEKLINEGIFEEADFVYNIETGNYDYLGESTDEIVNAIREQTAALLDEADLDNRVASGEIVAEMLDNGTNINRDSIDSMYKFLTNYLDQAGENAMISADKLEAVMKAKDKDEMKDLIDTVLSDYYNLENNKQLNETSQQRALAISAQGQSSAANLGMFQQSLLEGDIVGQEAYSAALIAQASAAGVAKEEIDNFTVALQSNDDAMKANAATALESAIASTKMNDGLSEITESYSTWTKLIDSDSGTIKARTSEEIKAFDTLKASVKQMLNLSEDLSDSFWDNADNIKLLKKAAEGDVEALEKLQRIASVSFLENLELNVNTDEAKNAITDFIDYYSTIDMPDLEAGMTWDGQSFEEFKAAFNSMAETANLDSQQIQEAIQAMGFNATITTAEQTRLVPNTVTETTLVKRGNPLTGVGRVTRETTHTDGYTKVTGQFPVIETMTKSGNYGGNVSATTIATGKDNPTGGGDTYQPSYDPFTNQENKINSMQRERNRLQAEYNHLQKTGSLTAKEANELQLQQLKQLKDEYVAQNTLLKEREAELKTFQSNSKYSKYAWYDETIGEVQIDYDSIEALRGSDSELGEAIDDYISELMDKVDKLHDGQDRMIEIQESIDDKYEADRDSTSELIDRVTDAIEAVRTAEIDELESLNDSISTYNSNIISEMRDAINATRTARERENTRQDLEEQRSQIAYLAMDTSGANQQTILEKQEALADAEQNYIDTLIDDLINSMEEANNDAKGQRAEQIALMREQLSEDKSSGKLAEEAWNTIKEDLGDNGFCVEDSQVVKLLQAGENWSSKNFIDKSTQLTSLAADEAAVRNFMTSLDESVKSVYDIVSTVSSQLSADSSNNDTTGGVKKVGSDVSEKKTPGKIVDDTPQEEKTVNTKTMHEVGSYNGDNKTIFNNKQGYEVITVDDKKYVSWGQQLVWYDFIEVALAGLQGAWIKNGAKQYSYYANGGLADYTGIAWLDGTPSKPEMVLNAADTANFIELRDTLREWLNSNAISSTSQNNGDNYYDIDINVEEISDDYSVEQLKDKIQSEILTEAAYRNVNAISLLR